MSKHLEATLAISGYKGKAADLCGTPLFQSSRGLVHRSEPTSNIPVCSSARCARREFAPAERAQLWRPSSVVVRGAGSSTVRGRRGVTAAPRCRMRQRTGLWSWIACGGGGERTALSAGGEGEVNKPGKNAHLKKKKKKKKSTVETWLRRCVLAGVADLDRLASRSAEFVGDQGGVFALVTSTVVSAAASPARRWRGRGETAVARAAGANGIGGVESLLA
ncbi:hypothetical protein DFH07DRAFT_768858 [Mycena maculata]|uniref:Uncharacterized protein n=1 Tax=Mycena maculata TaxID=230809 RepID=A0AAD7JQ65_9AGAR|nr:hypothetical protein DFH07DRAFT_768858 [Mycena maculata]